MKRILGGVFLLSLVTTLVIMGGCDSPNSPDVPQSPYHVAAVYPLPASANHAMAKGDLAAVADGVYGAVVLNVHDLAHIQMVARDTMGSPFAGAWEVALDTIDHLLVTTTEPYDSLNPRLFDYVTGEHVALQETYAEIYYAFAIDAQRNNVSFWGARRNFLHEMKWCRASDSSAWTSCDVGFVPYNFPNPSYGAAYRGQAIALREADRLLAVAAQGDGIHFFDDSSGTEVSRCLVPGSAWSCAWYRDSLLIVAADYQLVIVNASNSAQPFVLAQLQISSSNHMVSVAVDGTFACVLDGYDGIYVVDLKDPRNPVSVQLLPLTAPSSIYADNGRVYATDQVAGLVVISR